MSKHPFVEKIMNLVDDVYRRTKAALAAADRGDAIAAMAHNTVRLQAADKILDGIAELVRSHAQLLEACADLLQHASVTEHMSAHSVEKARAAISKATGSPIVDAAERIEG